MAMVELLVEFAAVRSAISNMNQAREAYQEAIDSVNAAAQDLASKWEGDGQVAFVADQAECYRWCNSLAQCAMEFITETGRMIDRYEDAVGQVKAQMG